jgi:hypothetical protein
MTSEYPGAIKTFTVKQDNVDDIMASHMNDVQDEISAIQTELGVNPSGGFESVVLRLNDLEATTTAAVTAYLGILNKAADSDLLDGHNTDYFATASEASTLSSRVSGTEDDILTLETDVDSIESIIKVGIPNWKDDPRPTEWAKSYGGKDFVTVNDTEATILKIDSGAGVIRRFYLTSQVEKVADAIIKIKPDGGEATFVSTISECALQPRVLAQSFWEDSSYELANGLKYISSDDGSGAAATQGKVSLTFPWGIPFNDGIEITITCPSGTSGKNVYANAEYSSGAHPWPLGEYGVLRCQQYNTASGIISGAPDDISLPSTCTGLITISGTAVTGDGSCLAGIEFDVGDYIYVGLYALKVISITDENHFTVNASVSVGTPTAFRAASDFPVFTYSGGGIIIAIARMMTGDNDNILENNWYLKIDGTEKRRGTGTEDDPDSGYYYACVEYAGENAGVLRNCKLRGLDSHTWTDYLIFNTAAWKFNESFEYGVNPVETSATSYTFKGIVLFYTES